MFLIILLSILIVLITSRCYIQYQNVWKFLNKLPGPMPWPILGNIPQLGTTPDSYLSVIRGWVHRYKYQNFSVYAGSQPYVICSNPKTVEHILSSTSLLYKSDIYDFLKPWLGEGLLTSNGQHWVKHRKMITPSFHFAILQDFLHIINETTDRFMILLDTFAEKGKIFDFQEIVTRSTIDVICESAMGIRVNSIEGQQSPMVKAINDICYVVQERVFSFFKRSDIFFFFTPLYRMQKNALKIMLDEFTEIIETRREILSKNVRQQLHNEYKKPKMAFLDNLLTAEIDGKPLTFRDIFDEVSTFMFEGHDTTASAVTFAVFCLSRHPEIQKKAFEEQLEIFGNDTTRSPTYQELQTMKYLEMVIKEVLRLFPSVPMIGRTLERATEIDGHIIPKDTTLILPIISIGTNPNIYQNPYKFEPERFDQDLRSETNPFSYVPFSAGPRNCIGQKYAWLEMKVTLSKIIRHFEILPPSDGLLSSGITDPTDTKLNHDTRYDPILAALATLKAVNGVNVRIKKRHY